MRKGKGRDARLSFMGHALMENGNGVADGLCGEQGHWGWRSVRLCP